MIDITVYTPVYNQAQYIKRALIGLSEQYLKPTQIIIVDDGSTDNSIDIAEKTCISNNIDNVTIVRHPLVKNRGLAASRNLAMKNAKTELVAAIDCDVEVTETWLEQIVMPFRLDDETIAASCGMLLEKHTKTTGDCYRAFNLFQHFGTRPGYQEMFFGSNHVVRKSVWERIGGFDESLKTNYEDSTFSLGLIKLGYKILYTPFALSYHLKRDTISSSVKTLYNWWRPFIERKKFTSQDAKINWIIRHFRHRIRQNHSMIAATKQSMPDRSHHVDNMHALDVAAYIYFMQKETNLEIDRIISLLDNFSTEFDQPPKRIDELTTP